MNRDDIIRMAREAGIPETEVEGVFRANSDDLGRLLAYEREACAQFLESGVDLKGLAGDPQMQAFCGALLMGCAKAIRARGNS